MSAVRAYRGSASLPPVDPRAIRAAVSPRVKLSYLPGLDGLRALAVLTVVAYHGGITWLPGGFLGVEVFFVISGFLITSLLLEEWRRSGTVELGAFWLRRARRLVPAVVLLVVTTMCFAVAFLPNEVARLRSDSLAALTYVTNWYLIFSQQSYFEAVGRPSLMRHLWSLAVEGQFYLIWPPVFVLAMRRWHPRWITLGVVTVAIASALLMALLYDPEFDPSRVYYGSDTRAGGLLAGVAVAFLWAQAGPCFFAARHAGLVADTVGVAALAALAVIMLRLGEFTPFLYQGGFVAVSVASAAAIAATVHPRARLLPKLLSLEPLNWIGLRSYGIYLWHWPVFAVTRPQLDVPIDGWPLLALRLVVSFGVAAVSYRYVETPIRRGALGDSWRELREARGRRLVSLGTRWAAALAVVTAGSVVLGSSVSSAQRPTLPDYLAVAHVDTVNASAELPGVDTLPTSSPAGDAKSTSSAPTPNVTPSPIATATPNPAPVAEPTSIATPTAAPTAEPAVAPMPVVTPGAEGNGSFTDERVIAIGDSVMAGAWKELKRAFPNLGIDAEVNRQAPAGTALLREFKEEGKIGRVVVVHLGSNGLFTPKQFDEMMEVLGDVPRVVFVNAKVPRVWEGPTNETIADGVRRYPNTVLVDWRAASQDHPEYFREDGIHTLPEGARVFADLIGTAVTAP